jgi:hypothetical protein
MRQQFRENSIFRRTEQGAVDAHSGEDDERQQATRRVDPKGACRRTHEEDLHRFHQDDDGSFADAVCQQTRENRHDGERECKYDKGERGLCL